MRDISEAIKILKEGGSVVYPTDTAYGLAVDATNAKAVEKLYRLKGRDFKKPVHVIASNNWIPQIVKLNVNAKKLIKKFFPGPLTIILPMTAKGKSWQKLSAKTKTMGIRQPNNKIALALVKAFGKPITTTSANVSGQPNCYSIAAVKRQFKDKKIKPDYYLKGGKLRAIRPSTIVSAIKDVKILRQGPITEKQIKNVLS